MARRRRRSARTTADARRADGSGGLLSSLDTAGKRVIAAVLTAGALATAATAITKLFAGPGERRAEVGGITVGVMSLDEYLLRRAGDRALAPVSHARMRLASYRLAQAAEDPAADSSTGDEGTSDSLGQEETGGGSTTGPSPSSGDERSSPPGTDTTPTVPEGGDDSTTETTPADPGSTQGSVRALPPKQEAALVKGVDQTLTILESDPETADYALPENCRREAQQMVCTTLAWMVANEQGGAGRDFERKLVRVFKRIRAGEQDDSTGERPLLGIDVNFGVSLTGLSGDPVDVRWSLHQAGGDLGAVPEAWFDKRVLVLEADRDKDNGSPEFWLPLPRHEGPFFLRVGLYHEGTRLAQEDSETFE